MNEKMITKQIEFHVQQAQVLQKNLNQKETRHQNQLTKINTTHNSDVERMKHQIQQHLDRAKELKDLLNGS